MTFPAKMPGKQPHEGDAIICTSTIISCKPMADGGYRVWLDVPDTDIDAAVELFKYSKKPITFYTVFQAKAE